MINTALLAQLVAATTSNPPSFMWLTAADYQPLVDAGFAEINGTVPGAPEEGQVATRATDAGIAAVDNSAAQNTNFGGAPAASGFNAAPQAAKPVFSFVSGFQPPAPKPRGRGAVVGGVEEKYPFGELKAPTINADGSVNYEGAAVFVPSNTHTKGDKKGQLRTSEEMAFSLQSACSAANRRYNKVIGEKAGTDGKVRKVYENTYDFKTAPAGAEQPGPGAYIYRAK